jgi:hypothetical protein
VAGGRWTDDRAEDRTVENLKEEGVRWHGLGWSGSIVGKKTN